MWASSINGAINDMLKRLTIIWAIMLGVIGGYVVITIFAVVSIGVEPQLEPDIETPLTSALITVALLNSGVLIFLDRTFRSESGIKRYLSGRGITALKGSITDENLDTDDKLATVILPHYVQLCLIRWALAEAVAIYGLILAFLTGDIILPTCFYILSAGLMAAMGPESEEYSELVAVARTIGPQEK